MVSTRVVKQWDCARRWRHKLELSVSFITAADSLIIDWDRVRNTRPFSHPASRPNGASNSSMSISHSQKVISNKYQKSPVLKWFKTKQKNHFCDKSKRITSDETWNVHSWHNALSSNSCWHTASDRENVYLPLANTSITYNIICLYAVVGCQKGQSPSKLATHCSKQHNNTQ